MVRVEKNNWSINTHMVYKHTYTKIIQVRQSLSYKGS